MGKGLGNRKASTKRKWKKGFRKELGFGSFADKVKSQLKLGRIKNTDIDAVSDATNEAVNKTIIDKILNNRV